MSLEQDLRNYLVQANTPAGNQIFFTTAPQTIGNTFITITLDKDDAQHTTQAGPGHLTFAILDVLCSVKGSDQYQQYVACKVLSDAVKGALNNIGYNSTTGTAAWPAVVGNTTIYFLSIESENERASSKGSYALPYQYQEGKGSGIQRISVPAAVNYWNPNN